MGESPSPLWDEKIRNYKILNKKFTKVGEKYAYLPMKWGKFDKKMVCGGVKFSKKPEIFFASTARPPL